MAAIWKGTVSFGLVSIPVKLHSATEERGVSFRQVHEEDGGRIRYKRVCSVDGAEVAYSDIAKGYELPDGDVVVITDEDLSALPLPSRHTIEVLQFVPSEQIDGLYFSKGYYLAAEGPGVKPYVLLRDALDSAGKVALVKVALRNRESLAVLRSREGALVVQTMLWPDEIRSPAAYAPGEDVTVRDQEVAMAESYIETLSEDFDPTAYSDGYREALEELVQAKTSGREVAEPAETPAAGGAVVDLMAALRASVEAARQRREGGSAATEPGAQSTAGATSGSRTAGSTRRRAATATTDAVAAASGDGARAKPARTRRKASEPAADEPAATATATSEPATKSGRRTRPTAGPTDGEASAAAPKPRRSPARSSTSAKPTARTAPDAGSERAEDTAADASSSRSRKTAARKSA